MSWIAITQRVHSDAQRNERYDAIDQRWCRFAERLGFLPLLIPNHLGLAREIWSRARPSGILLTGGNDLAALGGDAPERDEVELWLLGLAIKHQIPLIGVCRGMQLILHAAGTVLRQVEGHVACRHPVEFGSDTREVNSFHRYSAKNYANTVIPLASAPDGVIEAIRYRDAPVIGIMWHPEREDPFTEADLGIFAAHFGLSAADTPLARVDEGTVYWLTGLSGAGKTTVGRLLVGELRCHGRTAVLLDGDELREIFGNDLGHTADDRFNSAMRNSRLSRALAAQGLDVVCCTISMFERCRTWNRAHIPRYFEVYLKASLKVLKSRDPKGIYRRAARGELKDVYGIDLAWEEPRRPDLLLDNDGDLSSAEAAQRILNAARLTAAFSGSEAK